MLLALYISTICPQSLVGVSSLSLPPSLPPTTPYVRTVQALIRRALLQSRLSSRTLPVLLSPSLWTCILVGSLSFLFSFLALSPFARRYFCRSIQGQLHLPSAIPQAASRKIVTPFLSLSKGTVGDLVLFSTRPVPSVSHALLCWLPAASAFLGGRLVFDRDKAEKSNLASSSTTASLSFPHPLTIV